MPKVLLKIESEELPDLLVTREVKTLKDIQRLLKDADVAIRKAIKVFPAVATAKFARLTVK
jgi:hypothetical protein